MIPTISTKTLSEALADWGKASDFTTYIDTAFTVFTRPVHMDGVSSWASKWFFSMYDDWQLIDRITTYDILKSVFDKYFVKARTLESRKVNIFNFAYDKLFTYERLITKSEQLDSEHTNTLTNTTSKDNVISETGELVSIVAKDTLSSDTLTNSTSTNTADKELKEYYAPADTHALTDATMKGGSLETLTSVEGEKQATKIASVSDDGTTTDTTTKSVTNNDDINISESSSNVIEDLSSSSEQHIVRLTSEEILKLENDLIEVYDKVFRYFYPMFYGVL